MAMNIVVLGVTGILSLPALTSFFSPPSPDKILVNIGVGATNSNFTDGNPGGNCPSVAVFDVNGNELGFADGSDSSITDGGSQQLSISGAEGSTASVTPDYIQFYATGDNAVCISWFTTTSSASDGGDFRSWNGATAYWCGLPWYPSTAQFPGLATSYQPPCVWLSSDGRFLAGLSARLTDFFFPSSSAGQANDTATQWAKFPGTLCVAPARQQGYNVTGDCIPFYPSGLSVVNEKDPTSGFDVDFDAVESSFTMSCTSAGTPFNNNVDLGQPAAGVSTLDLPTTSYSIDTNPSVTIPAGVTLESSLTLPLARGINILHQPPTITTAASLLRKERAAPKHEPVLNRRLDKRAEQPHKWCEENALIISEFEGHNATEVCTSMSSWGPDFVSTAEGIFCDMCLRQTYLLCGDDENRGLSTSTLSSPSQIGGTTTSSAIETGISASMLNATSSDTATTTTSSSTETTASSIVSTASVKTILSSRDTIETCFDLMKKELRAPGKVRRDGNVPAKRYDSVRHWT